MTADLLCLVADKNMEAAVSGLLTRPESLGIAAVDHRIQIHPRRDPGCFYEAAGYLRGARRAARHALVILDHDWAGVPADSAAELEARLSERLAEAGLAEWARAVVIEPELEAWVFSGSPHVAHALGWAGRNPGLREALAMRSLWPADRAKPLDPKAAMEWALKQVRLPRLNRPGCGGGSGPWEGWSYGEQREVSG